MKSHRLSLSKAIIYGLTIGSLFSCSDKEQNQSSNFTPSERKVGQNLFLNLHSYMTESMYNDSINHLYVRDLIEQGTYVSNGTTIKTKDYTFTLADKNNQSINIKASLLPILEADSLYGVRLVFTIFHDPLKFDLSPCSSHFSEEVARSITDLYLKKYGAPSRPSVFNENVGGKETKFFLWELKDKAVFIRQSKGICYKTHTKSLYDFEIHYINKEYFKKSMWNPDVVETLKKGVEKRVKEKMQKTKENI